MALGYFWCKPEALADSAILSRVKTQVKQAPFSQSRRHLAICETFLNETVDDKLLTMNGYRFERKDRRECNPVSLNKGGGILIYISNNLNYSRRNDLESHEIESVWLAIELKNSKPFLICSFYRPRLHQLSGMKGFLCRKKNHSRSLTKFT